MVDILVEGTGESIQSSVGTSIHDALLTNGIPPSSVIVLADGRPVADTHRLEESSTYEAIRLERYDTELVDALRTLPSQDGTYVDRSLRISPEGDISVRNAVEDPQAFTRRIEQRVVEAVREYDLITAGDRVVLGLSGGVDSTALLAALCNTQEQLPPFDLIATTVEEPWIENGEIADGIAERMADRFDVRHRLVTQEQIREQYHLDRPVSAVIDRLRDSPFRTHVVPITDQLITRQLEATAEAESAQTVLLAAHAADVVMQHIDPLSETDPAAFPKRRFSDLSYAYPTVFLSKKELSMYLQTSEGLSVADQFREPWRDLPDEESLLYYLAELLRSYWPGIEHWIVTSESNTSHDTDSVGSCSNCGKLKGATDWGSKAERICPTCSILFELGCIQS